MALGLDYSVGGGDIIPIVKYDAKAGRVFRIDRVDGTNTPVDITRSFKAVVDMENVEVGFINFPIGAAPEFALVPLGTQLPARPSDKHKQGVRLMLKLSKECGGDVREMATCAKAAMRGVDELHDAYVGGAKANPGKLPVVTLKDTLPINSGQGAQKSTNYQPVFEIVGWVARPADLIFKPKTKSIVKQTNGAITNAASTQRTPPATGSTRVDAPPAAPIPTADELANDFG